jgi:hypothetical protein
MAINDSKWTDVSVVELTRFGFKVMVAGFLAIMEMLERCDSDVELKARMDRAKMLQEELRSLYQPLTKAATGA